jgi:transcriptional regulator with XRE-family HTH domain
MKSLRSTWHRSVVTVIIASRHDAKLTQVQLAAKLDWHTSKISKIESYERRIDVAEFIYIANALHIDPTELLTRALNW